MDRATLAASFSGALAAGEHDSAKAAERAARILGRRWRFLGPLARRYVAAFEATRSRAFDRIAWAS